MFYIFANLLLKSGITGGSGWILISVSALNQLQFFILDEVYKENQTINTYAVGKGGVFQVFSDNCIIKKQPYQTLQVIILKRFNMKYETILVSFSYFVHARENENNRSK